MEVETIEKNVNNFFFYIKAAPPANLLLYYIFFSLRLTTSGELCGCHGLHGLRLRKAIYCYLIISL